MSADRLCRERLRVERDLIGAAHPFIATDLVIQSGAEEWYVTLTREAPVLPTVALYRWEGHK